MESTPISLWIFHQPPIGGCLDKNLLDVFSRFVNIHLKHNLNAVEKGYFLLQDVRFSQKRKHMVLTAEKKILSTENNVRPNRDNSDHGLVMEMGVDLVSISSSLNPPFCSTI
jgi:hypothetical protein